MQIGQHIDEGMGNLLALVQRRQTQGVMNGIKRLAVDHAHQIEGRTGDRGVFAKAERLWHRHGGGAERLDQRPLATHVMRLGQQLAKRRTTDHRPIA